MITVAYLVHSLRAGGIERSVTRLVNGLDPNEYRSIIICLDRSGPAADWLEVDVEIVELKKRSGNDLRAIRRLSKTLTEHNVDIVQSHNWGTLVESVFARKLSRTSVHIHCERGTVMGAIHPSGLKHRLRAKAMAGALRQVNLVLSNSATVARRVEERCGYSAERIAIVPNGVPAQQPDALQSSRASIREKLGISDQSIIIGTIARLAEVKGLDLLIDAFSMLRPNGELPILLLVGDGPEKERLARQASSLKIEDRIHFAGQQPRPIEWLAGMDVFVNSSHSEGMSQSIIEALSCGVPVVATDVGDSQIVLGLGDEAAGTCVPPGDPTLLTNALQELAADPDKRTRIASAAFARHRKCFSESRLLHNIQKIYRGTLSGDSSSDICSSVRMEASQ